MQRDDPLGRIQCGMFMHEHTAGFRARVQKLVEDHVGTLYADAKKVAIRTNAMHRLPEIYRAGLDHTRTMPDAEKEQMRNEVMRKDPGFADYYEHAFYAYCAETVPELKEPNSVLRAMPPALPIALHELFKAVDSDAAVQSAEFVNKMGYLEKAFFIESMIRVAFYELLFTHKALRNISMVRSSRARQPPYGVAGEGGDAVSYRSFDVGNALADVATASIGAAGASAALIASQIREAETGSVASDWAAGNMARAASTPSARTPIEQIGDDSTVVSASHTVSVASEATTPHEPVLEPEPEEPAPEPEEPAVVPEDVAPSEATIDILSNFGHDKPFGELPEPTGPEVPDPPAPQPTNQWCCEDPKCEDGDLCGRDWPLCHCGDRDCNRGSVCLNLPPSVTSFTKELTIKIGDGVPEDTVITPGDSVSQVLE